MRQNKHDLLMLAKTYAGLEEVLAAELRELGAKNVKVLKRGVSFRGDEGFLYKANLWCRTALRILVTLKTEKIRDENDLYLAAKDVAWENIFEVNQTFAIDAIAFSAAFNNTLFVAQKTKDAIADRFREKRGRRPSVNTQNPEIKINIHISGELLTISLDSSGESLHRRGYRSIADRAPISEVLAAGILKLAGWDGLQDFIDPMCGSGTFPIEAALMAHNIPPNIFRREFSFMNWKDFDRDLFGLIRDKALEKEQNFHFSIYGFDVDTKVLMKARRNARTALMKDQINLQKQDFMVIQKPETFRDRGLLVFNPPYGIKLEANIPALYEGIGNTLKREFSGYTAWVFTSSAEGLKHVGLKPSRKIQLYNGKLESWLVRYDLYSGSKKQETGN